MELLSGQSYQDAGPSSEWMSQSSQQYQTLGATSLSHQDNPPTYDVAMATGGGISGGWTQPSWWFYKTLSFLNIKVLYFINISYPNIV